jgi:hypothetical protein
MAIKSFSGTRMKIKCCRGLIKATQNIITLVQQQQLDECSLCDNNKFPAPPP